jgi:hypothetical protein
VAQPDALHRFTGAPDAASALRTILAGARRYLDVQSIALDPNLFDDEVVERLVLDLARKHAMTRVRILVDDVSLLVARGHRLVELARRLPSKLEIRRADEPAPPRETTFVIADNAAVWLVPDVDVYAGWSAARDPVRAERLTVEFERRFERATHDPELRVLSI